MTTKDMDELYNETKCKELFFKVVSKILNYLKPYIFSQLSVQTFGIDNRKSLE